MSKLRINLSSEDVGALDKAIVDIVDFLKKENVEVIGPIPLPTRSLRFSKDVLTNVVHKRLMDLVDISTLSIVNMQKLNIPACVKVEMK